MRRWAQAGLVGALIAGFVADYPWGDWVGHSHWSNVTWIPFLTGPLKLLDVVQNLLLFSPVGFFCARLFPRRPELWAVALTLPVAFAGEWTQVYSHARFPSATDLVNNLCGAWAAAYLCRGYLNLEVWTQG